MTDAAGTSAASSWSRRRPTPSATPPRSSACRCRDRKTSEATNGPFWFLVSGFSCADLAEAIPELLRLADLEVRIPRLEILALERLADRDGKSVDAVLARDLPADVGADPARLAIWQKNTKERMEFAHLTAVDVTGCGLHSEGPAPWKDRF
jgi:hypothetical protein